MEEIAFSDWPGQAVDLSGTNPWLPAYGFQPPHPYLDREDFVGNPDADFFFDGSVDQHYVYLETIQEETSDDLRSESDLSESRDSPVGWLATDSESGSVIRINTLQLDEIDSGSEREIACPSKRRRQDNNNLNSLTVYSDDESNYSLSRSSSLLQFENLERQCQDISNSSPSILSAFSFDSLEVQRKADVSPDSLEDEEEEEEEAEPESDYYKSLKVDLARPKRSNALLINNNNNQSHDSLLYNATRFSSDSESSDDSERQVAFSKSNGSLKMSRSYEDLAVVPRTKMSSENLSEDSGYGDHHFTQQQLCARGKSNSNPDLARQGYYSMAEEEKRAVVTRRKRAVEVCEVKNTVAFFAYDSDCSFLNGGGGGGIPSSHFGSSYHDLRIINRYDVSEELGAVVPLFERSTRRAKSVVKSRTTPPSDDAALSVNLEKTPSPPECGGGGILASKYNPASVSEPNLLVQQSQFAGFRIVETIGFGDSFSSRSYSGSDGYSACSVPKNLNLAGEVFQQRDNEWGFCSIAAKNYDIADYIAKIGDDVGEDMEVNVIVKPPANFAHENSFSDDSELEMERSYKREGSYLEAMRNRVDLSDDDDYGAAQRACTTISNFDKKILKTISETSIQSLKDLSSACESPLTQHAQYTSTPVSSSHRRAVVSTPNLASFESDFERYYRAEDNSECDIDIYLPRKRSPINRSTSTAEMSTDEEKTLASARSLGGSTSSKGVHFCPVVAQVNWHEDSETPTTTDKESTYSYSSSPDPESARRSPAPPPPTPPLMRPKPRLPHQLSTSEPELPKRDESRDDEDGAAYETPRTTRNRASSQPDVGGLKRRGSQVVRKDSDGTLLLSYVDTDGIKYKHSHLGDVYKSIPPTPLATGHVFVTSTDTDKSVSQAKLPQKDNVVKQQVDRQRPSTAITMESAVAPKKSSGGKLGGFFSRLASFRFSTRKASDEKNKKKKEAAGSGNVILAASPTAGQRIATKDDYVYIPLKGPEKPPPQQHHQHNQNNDQQVSSHQRQRVPHQQRHASETACASAAAKVAPPASSAAAAVAAKPPLPKLPPRVVGASVKRRTSSDAFAHSVRPEHRTIDSGDAFPRPMEPMGLIETDLDTEVTVITSGAHAKTRSLMNLGAEAPQRSSLATPPHPARPHKSMEFLLDKQNLKVVEPPENELQKGERVMSEHQLRIQRSLQKLTIPDWYKQNQVPREGFLLKKSVNRERWTGTSSKTPSLSSLASNNQSPLILSPTPQTQPFVRWSTSKINSTASSPCASVRSSFNTRQPNGSISPSSVRSSFSYRQPYLGWRSQERLTRPPRTPAERLASSVYVHQQQQQQQRHHQQESPEIQTSIKEVTSAIVHYVSGLKPDTDGNTASRSSSASPRGSQKLCWLESSFVGTRPLDTPQTPVTFAESNASSPIISSSSGLRLELQKSHNGESIRA